VRAPVSDGAAAAIERLRGSVIALEARVGAMNLNGTTFANSMADAIRHVDAQSAQLALLNAVLSKRRKRRKAR
jgi:hypothetical protein